MQRFITFLFIIWTLNLFGQTDYNLSFSNDSIYHILRQYRKTHKDSISLIIYLRNLRSEAIKRGFLLSSYDSIYWRKHDCRVHLFLGPRFKDICLNVEGSKPLSNTVLSKIKGDNSYKIPFRTSDLMRMMRETEEIHLNKGYPFCSVRISDITFDPPNQPKGKLYIDKGQEYIFTKIIVKGDSTISEVFISSLTGIKTGDKFDESKLKGISDKIRQIPFISEVKPHDILFTESGCELYLYLRSNPVSSANGTIGLQPNPITNRVGLAGELNLKLINLLRRGELAQLNWRSIQNQTQSMQLKMNYPFLFKTAFGVDGTLQLYKKDTSFIELKSTVGIQYLLNTGIYLKAFFQHYSNNLLAGAKNSSQFQKLANITVGSYGLSLAGRSLDYAPNPSKGRLFLLEAAIGSRKSKYGESSNLERSTAYRVCLQMEWYLSVARRHVLRFSSANEFYYAPVMYENEIFRFGGQLSLRGFNEDDLLASARTVTTIEYRYLLDKNSNLFIFYDQGYYENSVGVYRKDHPFGFGAGLSFGTGLGIFSLSYALGSQQNNPILLRNGKIHFGYIAYF